jgi:hypothetical protein
MRFDTCIGLESMKVAAALQRTGCRGDGRHDVVDQFGDQSWRGVTTCVCWGGGHRGGGARGREVAPEGGVGSWWASWLGQQDENLDSCDTMQKDRWETPHTLRCG